MKKIAIAAMLVLSSVAHAQGGPCESVRRPFIEMKLDQMGFAGLKVETRQDKVESPTKVHCSLLRNGLTVARYEVFFNPKITAVVRWEWV